MSALITQADCVAAVAALRRHLYRFWWTTREVQAAYQIGNCILVSPKTAELLRREIAAARAETGGESWSELEIVADPHVPQYVREPRFPRLAALFRRVAA